MRADEGSDVAEEAEGRRARRQWRVLVADDNPGLRHTLTEILDREGYAVEEAANGEAALAALETSPIDVLILDLAMPVMDGVELLGRIDPPPPVVVIHSAFAYYRPDQVRDQVGSKVFRMVTKPAPPRQLVSIVAEAVAELDED